MRSLEKYAATSVTTIGTPCPVSSGTDPGGRLCDSRHFQMRTLMPRETDELPEVWEVVLEFAPVSSTSSQRL